MAASILSRRSLLAGLATLPAVLPAAAQRAGAPGEPVRIDIEAKRIATFGRASTTRQFGRLEFRGGLVLTSPHKEFGGLSGLVVAPDGRRFLAVSDEGAWLNGEIAYEGAAPIGIKGARMGPILGLGGRTLARKRDKDAEAIALASGTLAQGEVLIAFERNHRIARHPVVDGVILPPAGLLRMPAETRRMSSNKGLEAMTVLAGGPYKGAVVAISERFVDGAGDHTGWIWVQGEPRRFGFKEIGGFDVTDCAGLPDGSLLVAERRFRWTEGVKMQLRRLAPREIAPGAAGGTGEMLLDADMAHEIDNMEGLAVHRGPRGETVLTLISDDNFNALLQRTVLLQFALV